MKTLQRERTPLYVTDAKNCARHLVRESLDQILAGTFEIPSFEEMVSILERDFEHTFDEFMARRKIMKSHISWSREQVDDELEQQKIRYENELRVNLRVAALNTIEEIENLVKSLNQAIAEWKIENL
jgi:RNA processing factor Prp31